MKTWTEEDNALLPSLLFARQNGVPLLEFDPATGAGVPGDRVNKWGPGNWSGIGRGRAADAARRGLSAGPRATIPDLRLFLDRDAVGHGAHVSGLWLPLCHASGHERARAHLPCALPTPDGNVHVEHLIAGMAQFDKDRGQRQRDPAVPRLSRQSRSVLHLSEGRQRNETVRTRIGLALSAGPARLGAIRLASSRTSLLFGQLQRAHDLCHGANERNPGDLYPIGLHRSGQSGDHPPPDAAREQCRARAYRGRGGYANRQFERICGAKYMAPLYDPQTQTPRRRHGLHRPVRIPEHPLHLSGGLDQGGRGGADLCRDGQADVRRA